MSRRFRTQTLQHSAWLPSPDQPCLASSKWVSTTSHLTTEVAILKEPHKKVMKCQVDTRR